MLLPRVSVVIPCRNEAGYIEHCLDSILANDYPRDRLEILVSDGRSTDGTREILARYCARHPSVILLDNPQGTTPSALNAGVRAASGDVIIRMDAHVLYPPDYIRRLVRGLEESGADNVGGVLHTIPADDSVTARAIAVGMSHRFGVGNSHFRIGVTEMREVDTVPFGCFRRELFSKVGLFDEELVRNQDDEFNFRLITRGGRVLLLPEVSCRYFARRSLGQLFRMYFQYGYFKPLVARKVGRVMTARQLVPGLLVAGMGTLGMAGVWSPAAQLGLALLMLLYGSMVIGAAVGAIRPHGLGCSLALTAVFPVLHFGYGIGFLLGIWDHLVTRSVSRTSTLGLSR
jgi:glycosyltransferase involved in cell wall biosynthesis